MCLLTKLLEYICNFYTKQLKQKIFRGIRLSGEYCFLVFDALIYKSGKIVNLKGARPLDDIYIYVTLNALL